MEREAFDAQPWPRPALSWHKDAPSPSFDRRLRIQRANRLDAPNHVPRRSRILSWPAPRWRSAPRRYRPRWALGLPAKSPDGCCRRSAPPWRWRRLLHPTTASTRPVAAARLWRRGARRTIAGSPTRHV